jgi:TonB family protein
MDAPTPPPKPKTTVKYAPTPAPVGAKRGPVAVTGVVGGNPNGTKPTGVPGSLKGGGTWSMPHPPYPAAARASHVTGTTTVSISTDATGKVSNVTITASAGNAILDHFTQVYVKDNWKGPPNSTHTTTFEYRLQ